MSIVDQNKQNKRNVEPYIHIFKNNDKLCNILQKGFHFSAFDAHSAKNRTAYTRGANNSSSP
jgi:hypothetical protein